MVRSGNGVFKRKGLSGWARRAILLTTVLATSAAGVTTAVAAQATFQYTDDFARNPGQRWSFAGEGNHEEKFDTWTGGGQAAFLKLFRAGWSSVGIPLDIGTGLDGATCVMSFRMVTHFSGDPVAVRLEVIDPRSWTYVAVEEHTVDDAPRTYRATWTVASAPTDLFFRASLSSESDESFGSVIVDDFAVSCS